jgi:uncharacterized protein (TIGR03083 family)
VFDTAYREARTRVCELVSAMDAERLGRRLPATPQWSARELVAHLVGVAADVTSGNLEGITTGPWTAAQVDARRDRDLEQLFAEWDDVGPKLELAVAERRMTLPPVHDVTVHETDLREGHGLPRAPEHHLPALLNSVASLVARNHADKPGGVLLRSAGRQWQIGGGPPAAAVELEPYELYRGLFSRRSRRQLRDWPWQGDPDGFLDLLPVFGAREDDQPTIRVS